MGPKILKTWICCCLLFQTSQGFASEVSDLAVYNKYPRARVALKEYWKLFAFTKDLDTDSERYSEAFQLLLELERVLIKNGVSADELHQLRVFAEEFVPNKDLINQNEILKAEIIRLVRNLSSLQEFQIADSFRNFEYESFHRASLRQAVLKSLALDSHEGGNLVFRVAVGTIFLKMLIDLQADEKTVIQAHASLLQAVENLIFYFAHRDEDQWKSAYKVLVSALKPNEENGYAGEREFSSSLARAWKEKFPRNLGTSFADFTRALAKTTKIWIVDKFLVTVMLAMGTASSFKIVETDLAQFSGSPGLLFSFFIFDAIYIGSFGYATWLRYSSTLSSSRVERFQRKEGLNVLGVCKKMLSAKVPDPKLLTASKP